MKINYKESQIDFLAHVNSAQQQMPPRYMAAQISLSLENLVILSIVAIMFVIFSFSLGIERGKRIALAVSSTEAGLADATAVTRPSVAAGRLDKASEKAETKEKAESPAPKGFLFSSQSLVKLKATPVADDAPAAVQGKENVSPSLGGYTLQVASYKATQHAQREADRLKQKGFNDVYVLTKGAYTILCVGNFQKKEDASLVKRQLKGRYQDFVVRRL